MPAETNKPFGSDRRVSVKAEYAAMLQPFASTEKHRYCLNGIYVAPHPDGGVLMVATNGHIMGVIRDKEGESNGPWICRIPRDVARAVNVQRRSKKRVAEIADRLLFTGTTAYVVNASFDIEAGDMSEIGPYHLIAAHAPPIDGTFPDYHKVLPTEIADGGCVALARHVLEPFLKIAAMRMATGVDIHASGRTDPCVIFVPNTPEFFGVAMPFRSGVEAIIPQWIASDPVPNAAE